ncbi:MAG: O-antigen ligase family protein, partial [Gammaproteobacteria bacterium]|nr:O-antigen ligase family protein [Gammaproteobacteria bacterium]
MIQSLKELAIVLAIALLVFRLARPMALRFMHAADFSRRCNLWLALTAAGLLSPSFWLFVAVAVPLLIWAGRRDSNLVALYLLLLHVVPPVPVAIPVIGINQLFDLDNYRLLAFCVLIPAALRLRRNRDDSRIVGLRGMDVLLLAFGALQVATYIPPDLPHHVILPDSVTNVLRRAVLFLVDVYALYYVVSRGCAQRTRIAEAMATFCLGCAVMALVAVFETARHWLLYADIVLRWNDGRRLGNEYLERGGILRAESSAGHPLALGYLLAVAFGFWLYLRTRIESRWMRILGAAVLWLGLLAAYSRGPWIGAVAIYLAFMVVGPGAFARTFKAIAAIAVVIEAVSFTPFGDRIARVLPFFGGSVDRANVTYRQRLLTRSWQLIQQHPFFGDRLALLKMEDLRQGQGIIDVVNAYASIALFYGLVGLFLILAFVLSGLAQAFRAVRATTVADPDFALLGASLVACTLGTLL